MFLSGRDVKWAIQTGRLIVDPPPENFGEGYDETSIDLHLDTCEEARVWDIATLDKRMKDLGGEGPEVRIGKFNWGEFSREYLIAPPADASKPVVRRGHQIVVKPHGFLLWQTKERVGTSATENPDYICFVNAKSTRARTGLLVHLTAPTIHAGWNGKITLEILNAGPFHFVIQEDDVIAQLTVATISSTPDLDLKKRESATANQRHVTGKE